MAYRSTKKQGPPSSVAPLFMVAGVALAIAGWWFHFPGGFALWLAFLLAAWMEPSPELTGPKSAGQQPTPANDREEKKLEQYQIFKAAQTRLLWGGWFEWPPLIVWFLAVALGAWMWFYPMDLSPLYKVAPASKVILPFYAQVANALGLYLTVAGMEGSIRTVKGSPGVRFSNFTPWGFIGTVAGVAIAFIAAWLLPSYLHRPPIFGPKPLWYGLTILIGALFGTWVGFRHEALAHWRELVVRRKVWKPVWQAAKVDPAPYLYETSNVGPAVVDEFQYRGSAMQLIEKGDQYSPHLGAGLRVAWLTVADEKSPGVPHPNKLAVAQWPGDQWPNLSDPQLADDVRLLAVRSEWQPQWAKIKMVPGPEAVGSRMVGPARVDSFVAPSHLGAGAFWPLNPKIAPMVGATNKACIVPGEGIGGPGDRHPLNFDIVTWPSIPDIREPDADPVVVKLLLTCQFIWTAEAFRLDPMIPTNLEPMASVGSPQCWAIRGVGGPGMKSMRTDGVAAAAAGELGCDALVDHRDGPGVIYLGELESTEFVDEEQQDDPENESDDLRMPGDIGGEIRDKLKQLSEEDRWDRVWEQALKMGQPPPVIQHKACAERQLADGTTVYKYAFGVLSGIDPVQMYFGLEDKVRTALTPSPFLAIAGFTQKVKGRAGERHAQAFCVYQSPKAVPTTADKLPPSPAAEWVLIGMVNKAFKDARLPQPEVTGVRCLSVPRRSSYAWEIKVRPYGGVTLSDVRGARDRLRQGLGVPWLRVGSDDDGMLLYAGADPENLTLGSEEKDRFRVQTLDWEQAWLDSGVTGAGGLLPRLSSVGHLEKNDKVQTLEFDLPPGVSVADVKKGVEKLKVATGYQFIEIRPSKHGVSKVNMLCSPENPMPFPAPYDIETTAASKYVPFATGVNGDPVAWDWKTSSHLLFVGLSGSGKSIALQMLIEGIMLRGAELYVIDPTKGAADFKFVEPWTRFMATDIFESAALMRGLYAEVVRRKNLNSQYGVGSYSDLPEKMRPPHVVIILDEFTSLIETEKVATKPYDDFELERERMAKVAENNARVMVGQFAGKMARESRSAGVTLVLATQKLKADTLSKIPGGASVKDNAARVLLGKSTYGDRASALRDPESAPELGEMIPKGRGIYEPSDGPPESVQVWYTAITQLIEWLEERVPHVTNKFDVTPFLRKPDDEEDGPMVVPVDLSELGFSSSTEDTGASLIDLTLDDLTDDGDGGLDLSSLVIHAGGVSTGETEETEKTEELEWGDDLTGAANNPFDEQTDAEAAVPVAAGELQWEEPDTASPVPVDDADDEVADPFAEAVWDWSGGAEEAAAPAEPEDEVPNPFVTSPFAEEQAASPPDDVTVADADPDDWEVPPPKKAPSMGPLPRALASSRPSAIIDAQDRIGRVDEF